MIPLLTLSLVVLGVGLTLLVMAFSGRKRPAPDPTTGEPTPEPPARQVRIVPLVIGLVLSIVGGAGAARILTDDADKYDKMVLAMYPADWLVDDLNSGETLDRQNAFHELTRRYKAGELPEGAHRRLVARKIAGQIGDRTLPDAPALNTPIVDVNILEARHKELLGAKEWGAFVARTTPLRLDVPRQAEPGTQIALRTDASLVDPKAPAWVIIKVEDLKIGDVVLEPMPAIAVAANPKWEPPPAGGAGAGALGVDAGDAPAQGPPVLRRVVRYPYTVPAELVAPLQQGTFPVTGKILVFAFDSTLVAPPLDLMTDAATGIPRRQRSEEDLVAVSLSAQLTPEQFETFRSQAHGTHTWPVDREIRLGNPSPPRQPPPEQPPAEPKSEQSGDQAS